MPHWSKKAHPAKSTLRIVPGKGFSTLLMMPEAFAYAWRRKTALQGEAKELEANMRAHCLYPFHVTKVGPAEESYRLPDVSGWSYSELAVTKCRLFFETTGPIIVPPGRAYPEIWRPGMMPKLTSQLRWERRRASLATVEGARAEWNRRASEYSRARSGPHTESGQLRDSGYCSRDGREPWVAMAGVLGWNGPESWVPIRNCLCIDCVSARARDWRNEGIGASEAWPHYVLEDVRARCPDVIGSTLLPDSWCAVLRLPRRTARTAAPAAFVGPAPLHPPGRARVDYVASVAGSFPETAPEDETRGVQNSRVP